MVLRHRADGATGDIGGGRGAGGPPPLWVHRPIAAVLVDLDAFGYSNADLTALKNCLSLLAQGEGWGDRTGGSHWSAATSSFVGSKLIEFSMKKSIFFFFPKIFWDCLVFPQRGRGGTR